MTDLRYRLAIIVALIAASVWSIWPRPVVRRLETTNNVIRYDTVRADPHPPGPRPRGRHAPDAGSRRVEAGRGEQERRDRPGAQGRPDPDRPVRRVGAGRAEVGNDRIVVELPGVQDQQRAYDIVKDAAFLQMQIVDKSQALDKVAAAHRRILKSKGLGGTASKRRARPPRRMPACSLCSPAPTQPSTPATAPRRTPSAAEAGAGARRGKGTTPAGKKADSASDYRQARFECPGQHDGRAVLAAGPAGPHAGRVLRGRDRRADDHAATCRSPRSRRCSRPGRSIRWSNDTVIVWPEGVSPFYVLDAHPIITGEYLINANPRTDPIEGHAGRLPLEPRRRPPVPDRDRTPHQGLHGDRARQRRDGSPPVIQSAIGTNGQITMGGKDLQAAQDLALVLRAGALPVPLKVAEVRQIGASLGQDSVAARRPRRGHRHAARGRDHAGLLPVLGDAGGRRPDALHALHAGRAGGIRCGAHAARARRLRPVDRYRRRRQRADLRAHPRRTGPRARRRARRSTRGSGTP